MKDKFLIAVGYVFSLFFLGEEVVLIGPCFYDLEWQFFSFGFGALFIFHFVEHFHWHLGGFDGLRQLQFLI